MTVQELIRELEKCEQDATVVIRKWATGDYRGDDKRTECVAVVPYDDQLVGLI